jgi:hypothetical protein
VSDRTGVKITNLRQFHRALKDYDEDLKRELEQELKDAADIVRTEARRRFSAIDVRSAAGFRPRVRGFGRVVVEQSRRRTSGLRGDFGSLQMRRALIPAVADNQGRVLEAVEGMLDRIGRQEGF